MRFPMDYAIIWDFRVDCGKSHHHVLTEALKNVK